VEAVKDFTSVRDEISCLKVSIVEVLTESLANTPGPSNTSVCSISIPSSLFRRKFIWLNTIIAPAIKATEIENWNTTRHFLSKLPFVPLTIDPLRIRTGL